MISFKQIRYALAVEKHLHFRKAADECAVSQSALSSALAELERSVGKLLFERGNRKVMVTQFGRHFLKKARDIKLSVVELEALSMTQSQALSNKMSVGFIPTVCPYLLPLTLPILKREHPEFEMQIIEDCSRALIEKVLNGDIDTAVIALPANTEGLLSFELWSENFYWLTTDEFEGCNVNEKYATAVDPSSLVHENIMLVKEGNCFRQHVLNVCGIVSSQAHSLDASNINTLVQLVKSLAGSTIVPEMALSHIHQSDKAISVVPLSAAQSHRRLAFVVRPTYTDLKSVEAIIEIIRKSLLQSR